MRIRRFTILAALAAAPLAAQVPPQPGSGDPRIQTVAYEADRVVRLEAAPGYQVTVEFGSDEQIENVAVGDSAAWQVTPNRRGDYLFVKLVQGGVATNMTVVTTARTYFFELAPIYGPTPDMAFNLRFTYPGVQPESVADEAPTSELAGRYKLSGARTLRPSKISDDGRHTYIEWPRDRTLPAVYAIDPEGRESLVNGAMRDDLYVIDSVASKLVFRIDDNIATADRVVPKRKKRR
ncbi:MAG: type secretion system protein VirB9 [Sphingomonadales bacterium]|nr:type secretion system protein VirB9 [Sphingomonadales bacterium]